jgi:hypothetical protein
MPMHAARLDHSDRLRAVSDLLADGLEHSTMEIIHAAQVCAVSAIISELRVNGLAIPPARRDGDIWYYRQIIPGQCGRMSNGHPCRMPAGSACPDCSVSLHDFGLGD